jgi:hypothetical protein
MLKVVFPYRPACADLLWLELPSMHSSIGHLVIMGLATEFQGDRAGALQWYKFDTIVEFGKTAVQLVNEGRSRDVLSFLMDIHLGRRG